MDLPKRQKEGWGWIGSGGWEARSQGGSARGEARRVVVAVSRGLGFLFLLLCDCFPKQKTKQGAEGRVNHRVGYDAWWDLRRRLRRKKKMIEYKVTISQVNV